MTDTSNSEVDLSSAESQQEIGQLSPGIRGALNKLGSVLQEKNQAEAEAASLRRELAVERAGLPDFPGKQFFLNAYGGDATPEAVRAAAAAAGFITADGAPLGGATEQVSVGELQAHRQIIGASAGGQTAPVGEDLQTAILNAKSPADVHRIIAEAQGLPNVNFVPAQPI